MDVEKVWVVQEFCGDYYCGCGGGHIVGIYKTEESADREAGESDGPYGGKITEVMLEVTKPTKLRTFNGSTNKWEHEPWT